MRRPETVIATVFADKGRPYMPDTSGVTRNTGYTAQLKISLKPRRTL